MRKPFVAGNWKMNTDSQSGVSLLEGIASGSSEIASESVDIAVFPPFIYLQSIIKILGVSNIAVGAQDFYFEPDGAFTGEISVSMLKDIGCTYALCGHSERRHVIGETDELINKKVAAAISGGPCSEQVFRVMLRLLVLPRRRRHRHYERHVKPRPRKYKRNHGRQVAVVPNASDSQRKRPGLKG